jgi:4-amino-4-deoxy-L-arabinose transferase-like glycosyltransferase
MNFLTFSDGAKFADIARNIVMGKGYGTIFSFWSTGVFDSIRNILFESVQVPPVMPYSIAAFFKIFGVNDFAVIATSVFYFVLLLIFVFLLGSKLSKSKLVGLLSTVAVGLNTDMINYATSGASEMPLMAEIVASAYFLSLKKKWANIVGFVLMILMYFTRPQGFIYIAGLILYFLLLNFNWKKALITFLVILTGGFLFDKFVLSALAWKYFLYPILGRGLSTVNQAVVTSSTSEALRGDTISYGIVLILKKVFYDLYNFYKLLPQIMSPYLFAIFAIGIAKSRSAFKTSVLFMTVVTFLVTAISIPFFRYLHPIVPLVYIVAVATLIELVSSFQSPVSNKLSKFQFPILILTSTFLIFLFGAGQTLGVLLLDSRYEGQTHNVGKPPEYVLLSKILKDNTQANQVVVTNLDTWGSWYGERKTIWYPLEPDMLQPPVGGQTLPFDAIYLTSYLIDDANYVMGPNWRQIYNDPQHIADKFISANYKLKGIYTIPASDDYENQGAKAVLLVRK